MKRGFKLDFVPEGAAAAGVSAGRDANGKRTPNGRRAAADRRSPGRSPGRSGGAAGPAGAAGRGQDGGAAGLTRSPGVHDGLRAASPRGTPDEVRRVQKQAPFFFPRSTPPGRRTPGEPRSDFFLFSRLPAGALLRARHARLRAQPGPHRVRVLGRVRPRGRVPQEAPPAPARRGGRPESRRGRRRPRRRPQPAVS